MTIKGSSNPEAVQILVPDGDCFVLEEDNLRDILYQPNIKEMKCAVISVAGAFRKGKSFLLNFFVNYLEHLERGGEKTSHQWCSVDTVLDKFRWRCGSKQDTHGIWMWSHPFILEDSKGEKVAVFLMDTQGAFDSTSTFKQCASIFALSTMMSSLQIYNLSMNLQEDDLHHLNLFTEYAKLASSGGGGKTFQQLMFLIRDWQNSDEHEYGFDGGNEFLEEKLKVIKSQKEELQEVRRDIRNSFQSIECFLMPHPGLKIANNNKSETLGEAEKDFVDQIKQFVPSIFDKKDLIGKEICGQSVTCERLLKFFQSYSEVFKSGDLPEPNSILKATVEVINVTALAEAKAQYEIDMVQCVYSQPPLADINQLLSFHSAFKSSAVESFNAVKKFGDEKEAAKYRKELEDFTEAYLKNAKVIVEGNKKIEERRKEEEKKEKERQEEARRERERMERERQEMERKRQESERRAREERERIEAEKRRLEREREENERIEKERQEQARRERERMEKERKEEQERLRREKEKMERERREEEERRRKEKEMMKEKMERERREEEERRRKEKERMERERREEEQRMEMRRRAEEERIRKAREEEERRARERREQEERERRARIQREKEEEEERRREARERREREEREQIQRISYWSSPSPSYGGYGNGYFGYNEPSYSPSPSSSGGLREGYSFDSRAGRGGTGRYRAPNGRFCSRDDAFD